LECPNKTSNKDSTDFGPERRYSKEIWNARLPGPIGVGGASMGNGMLFVPTGKIQSYRGVGGSIVAFGLPRTSDLQ